MKTDVTKLFSCLCSKQQTQLKKSQKELCIKRTIKRTPHKEKRIRLFKKGNKQKFHKIFHQPFFSSFPLQKVTSQNVNNARSTTLSDFFISHSPEKQKFIHFYTAKFQRCEVSAYITAIFSTWRIAPVGFSNPSADKFSLHAFLTPTLTFPARTPFQTRLVCQSNHQDEHLSGKDMHWNSS